MGRALPFHNRQYGMVPAVKLRLQAGRRIMFLFGRLCRMAWNGPFYIGRIERPASVGDVLMKFLETAWRTVVLIALLALAAIAATGLWYEIISPKLFPPLEKQLKISARWDDGKTPDIPGGKNFRCTPDYPVLITIENEGKQAVGAVSFDVTARPPSRSTDVASPGLWHDVDAIIKPGYSFQQCWSVPLEASKLEGAAPSALIYEATIKAAKAFDGSGAS